MPRIARMIIKNELAVFNIGQADNNCYHSKVNKIAVDLPTCVIYTPFDLRSRPPAGSKSKQSLKKSLRACIKGIKSYVSVLIIKANGGIFPDG